MDAVDAGGGVGSDGGDGPQDKKPRLTPTASSSSSSVEGLTVSVVLPLGMDVDFRRNLVPGGRTKLELTVQKSRGVDRLMHGCVRQVLTAG